MIKLFTVKFLYEVKLPPIIRFPSESSWMSYTTPFPMPSPTTKLLSIEPVVVNFIILFTFVPLYCVNEPPKIIDPSERYFTAKTLSLNPVPKLNELSTFPLFRICITLLVFVPSYSVNEPTTIKEPLGKISKSNTYSDVTRLENPPLPKVVSIVPLLSNLTNL